MKNDLLYDNIMNAIKEKIPNRVELTNTLVDLLNVEKEAVYRRLRGEVAFSFSEITAISSALGISLDNLAGGRYMHSRPFQLRLVEYFEPSDIDYKMLEHYVYILEMGKGDPASVAMDCTSVLPQSLYLSYETITRFFLFKWRYQYGESNKIVRFKNVYPSEYMQKILARITQATQNIARSFYIWDPLIFDYLVNDIKYYFSINLLTEEDLGMLKNELLLFLDDMEVLACKGQFNETGNRVYFYISNMNIDTSYRTVSVRHFNLSMIRAFTLNAVVSMDRQTFEWVNSWMRAILKSSTMISVSGARQRVQFFEKQRNVITGL